MIEPLDSGVVLHVRVIPRAAQSRVAGTRDNALLVRLNAPPVEGAANAELIAVLAGALGVSRRAVTILSGESSRTKRILIAGVTAEQVSSLAASRT